MFYKFSIKMPQLYLSATKLIIILSVIVADFQVQGQLPMQKGNDISPLDDGLMTNHSPSHNGKASKNKTQFQSANRPFTSAPAPPAPPSASASAPSDHSNESRKTGEDLIQISDIQHEANESNEFASSTNRKSNVTINDTLLCFDYGFGCNLTEEEFLQNVYDYLRPGVIKWILILSHTVVFVVGLMGNALVCLAVYVNYSMRTVTNIFIVNLAVADFLVILVCLPPSVVWDLTETWFLGETMCKIVLYFQTVSVAVSVFTLAVISIDRWYAICFPLRYRTKISRAITAVSIIWLIAILLDIPEFLALTVKRAETPYESIFFSQCATTWSENTEKNFCITKLLLLFVIPLLLMIAAYFKIATVLWKSDALLVGQHASSQYGSRVSGGVNSNRGTISQLQARRKAAKMMVVVVIMFAICYLPIHVFNMLRHTGNLESGEITKILALCSHWLCYANSAINPVIYNFMSGKFRREFRNAFGKCRCSNVRVEDNFLYKNGPSSRQQNNSSGAGRGHKPKKFEHSTTYYFGSGTQTTNTSI